MADSSEVRQRKSKPAPEQSASSSSEEESSSDEQHLELIKTETKVKKRKRSRVDDEDDYTPWVDILRVLSFLFVVSCGLSYVISNGESFFWGMKNKPKYLRVDWWKSQFDAPLEMTLDELSAYDGTDPSKPIYLSINGSIYDVSAGRRMYGPGGGYHFFAGTDASRGFVTGCFAEDRTQDMRGVEEMFLPIDDPEIDSYWSPDQQNRMRKEERRKAKQQVQEGLKHWVDFFAKSQKYHYVGKVKREKDWLKSEPRKKLCDVAQQGRAKRKIPEKKG